MKKKSMYAIISLFIILLVVVSILNLKSYTFKTEDETVLVELKMKVLFGKVAFFQSSIKNISDERIQFVAEKPITNISLIQGNNYVILPKSYNDLGRLFILNEGEILKGETLVKTLTNSEYELISEFHLTEKSKKNHSLEIRRNIKVN